jgi:hypothetical protein
MLKELGVTRINKSGSYRSAKSGRYVTKAYGASHPKTTVKESPGRSGSTGGQYRSAMTGRFVTAKRGKVSPQTTLREK